MQALHLLGDAEVLGNVPWEDEVTLEQFTYVHGQGSCFGKRVRWPCARLTCIHDVLPRDPKYCRFLLRRCDR